MEETGTIGLAVREVAYAIQHQHPECKDQDGERSREHQALELEHCFLPEQEKETAGVVGLGLVHGMEGEVRNQKQDLKYRVEQCMALKVRMRSLKSKLEAARFSGEASGIVLRKAGISSQLYHW